MSPFLLIGQLYLFEPHCIPWLVVKNEDQKTRVPMESDYVSSFCIIIISLPINTIEMVYVIAQRERGSLL